MINFRKSIENIDTEKLEKKIKKPLWKNFLITFVILICFDLFWEFIIPASHNVAILFDAIGALLLSIAFREFNKKLLQKKKMIHKCNDKI